MPLMRTDNTWTVLTVRPVIYSVSIVDDYFAHGNPDLILGHKRRSNKRAVVIDHEVNRLYGEKIFSFFDRHEIECHVLKTEITEANKTLESVRQIWDWLKRVGVDRQSEPPIAIGGGAETDAFGYAISSDSRGKPWIRIVTTGQMWDAGTSAKTACNYPPGKKSGIGSFHAPAQTIVDRTFLASLSEEQITDNIPEGIKYALMHDKELFRLIKSRGQLLIREKLQGTTPEGDSAAREFLERCIQITLDENCDNIEERDLRRSMHFGHTWSPAWEMAALARGASIPHGRAVCLDMALSTVISWQLGLLGEPERDEIIEVIHSLNLPAFDPIVADKALLAKATDGAIASRDGHLLLPLSHELGSHEFRTNLDFRVIATSADWLSDNI